MFNLSLPTHLWERSRQPSKQWAAHWNTYISQFAYEIAFLHENQFCNNVAIRWQNVHCLSSVHFFENGKIFILMCLSKDMRLLFISSHTPLISQEQGSQKTWFNSEKHEKNQCSGNQNNSGLITVQFNLRASFQIFLVSLPLSGLLEFFPPDKHLRTLTLYVQFFFFGMKENAISKQRTMAWCIASVVANESAVGPGHESQSWKCQVTE